MEACQHEPVGLVAPAPSTTGPQATCRRGARRRLEQRARRKRGKLERKVWAGTAALTSSYDISDVPVPAIMEVDHHSVNWTLEQQLPDTANSDLMQVPVCETMAISELEEDESYFEVSDVLKAVPMTTPLQPLRLQPYLQSQKLSQNAPMAISQIGEEESSLEVVDVFLPMHVTRQLLPKILQERLPSQKLALNALPVAPTSSPTTLKARDTSFETPKVAQISVSSNRLTLEVHVFDTYETIPVFRTFIHFPCPSVEVERLRSKSV